MSESEGPPDDWRAEARRIAREEAEAATTISDDQGREWSVGQLMAEFSLSRRQALMVVGLLAAGNGLGYALLEAGVGTARAGNTSTGTIGSGEQIDGEFEDIVTTTIETDKLNTADASAAAQGEVLQKGASGTDLTFAAAGSNIVGWQEDGNSPFTATGANSITCSFASNHDELLVFVKSTDNNGNSNNADIQLNGVTSSDYFYLDVAETSTSNDSKFANGYPHAGNDTTTSVFRGASVVGRVGLSSVTVNQTATTIFQGGNINGESPPFSSITFDRTVSTDFTVEVYGKTIA